MAKFKFPRNPGLDRENPFEDDSGNNPFGDADKNDPPATETPTSDAANPYTPSQQEQVAQPYCPDDYETFLPHRAGLIFWLGVAGVVVQLLGSAAGVIAVFIVGDFSEGLAYGLPGQLVGLAISIPAWVMGHTDYEAIEANAMSQDGRQRTRAGLRLGILGTLLGCGHLVLFFILLIRNSFWV